MLKTDWTAQQLSNQTKLTITEAKIYSKYSADIRKCKKSLVDGMTNASPAFSNAMENALARVDRIDVELKNRRMSWGEAALKTQESAATLKSDLLKAVVGIEVELQQAHQEEVAKRNEATGKLISGAAAVGGAALAVAASRNKSTDNNSEMKDEVYRLEEDKRRLEMECRKATNSDGINAWKFSHC